MTRYNIMTCLRWAWPVALLAYVFWTPMTTSGVLFHADWAPFFPASGWISPLHYFVELGRPPAFTFWMMTLLPCHVYHLYSYPTFSVGIMAVTYLFLRDRGLSRLSAYMGGLSLGLAGYMLTLVSAGHRTVFDVIFTSVLIILCLDRGVRRVSPAYSLAAGILISYGLGAQPDIMVLFGLAITAYSVGLLIECRAAIRRQWRRFAMVVAFAVAGLAISMPPVIKHLREYVLPGRQSLIVQAESAGHGGGDGRWEFCTNWSLPLRDSAELVVPLLFGTETSSREEPYWGEIGQSAGWKKDHIGFRNFRQHTVYVGLVQVVFALFGMLATAAVLRGKTEPAEPQQPAMWQPWFWFGVLLVSLLLAFGRYLPFYRLFFWLPLADSIRCPIKFLHLSNLAISVLLAYGVEALLTLPVVMQMRPSASTNAPAGPGPRNQEQTGQRRNDGGLKVFTCPDRLMMPLAAMAAICSIAAVSLLILRSRVSPLPPELAQLWAGMGFDHSLQPRMLQRLVQSLDRALLLAGLMATLFACARFQPSWLPRRMVLGCLLAAVIGLDMATVARRYVHTIDVSDVEAPNAAVEAVEASPSPRIFDALTSRGPLDPMRANLANYYSADVELFDTEFGNYPELLRSSSHSASSLHRLLCLTATRYVLGTRNGLSGLAAAPGFTVTGRYRMDDRRIVTAEPAEPDPQILMLGVEGALPRAAVVQNALAVDDAASALAVWRSASWNPNAVVLIQDGPPGLDCDPGATGNVARVTFEEYSGRRIRMRIPPDSNGFLLLNKAFDGRWTATIDDTPVTIHRANYCMMATRLPTGATEVLFRHEPGRSLFWFCHVPSLVILLVAIGVAAIADHCGRERQL